MAAMSRAPLTHILLVPALGLLVAQGTSPLRLAVAIAFLMVVSVTSGGSNRRQGGEAAARLPVADRPIRQVLARNNP